MPSLTHVHMFTEHGWRKITVSEAAKVYPGTVSAGSGIFMCELCHQYVSFTRPGYQERHFRHRPDEDRSCPERTWGAGAGTNCRIEKHDLPIRLKLLPADFTLELGLLGMPGAVMGKLKNQTVQIRPTRAQEPVFVYRLRERLQEDRITYVSIGARPFPEYEIKIDCRDLPAFSFWPERVRGIDPQGTLFDARSCKKIPYDGDLQTGRPYYLLRKNRLSGLRGSVSAELVLKKSLGGGFWYLYKVSARALDGDAARFFLGLHCRLTDQPVSIQPIWPVYTKGPYVIHHNSPEMVFYVRGNVTTKCFPWNAVRSEPVNGRGSLTFVRCAARQQLISAGHDYALEAGQFWRRLKYTYLWLEPLDKTLPPPAVSVTDVTGQEVPPGETERLPPKNILRVSAPYDGLVIVRRNGRVLEKRRLKADAASEFDSIRYGCEVEVFQGLDRVWALRCQRRKPQTDQEEGPLLSRLRNAKGPPVPVPHAWGAAAGRLGEYPQVKGWLYQKIREGSMPEDAYRQFRRFIERLAVK